MQIKISLAIKILYIQFVPAGFLPHFKPSIDGRIVGGQATDISRHPWQVSLQIFGDHFCGGSLITDQWVLTAAHCVDNILYQRFLSVRVGTTNTNSGGQVISPNRFVVHTGWNFKNTQQYDNDIALIRLASPVTIATARPVALPAANTVVPTGANIIVTGWGDTIENGTGSSTLLEVAVPKVTTAQCSQLYSNSAFRISNVMLCAGVVGVGGKDACQGDSGGPATFQNQLVGVVSWGIGCARADRPGVYARVTSYLSWISSTIA